MPPQRLVGQLHGRVDPAEGFRRPDQQPVVRPYKDVASGGKGHTAPRGPHPRVDDADVDRGRELGNRVGQHGGAAPHIPGRDVVGDVDDGEPGCVPQHLGAAGGHETVLGPVIGQESETGVSPMVSHAAFPSISPVKSLR